MNTIIRSQSYLILKSRLLMQKHELAREVKKVQRLERQLYWQQMDLLLK